MKKTSNTRRQYRIINNKIIIKKPNNNVNKDRYNYLNTILDYMNKNKYEEALQFSLSVKYSKSVDHLVNILILEAKYNNALILAKLYNITETILYNIIIDLGIITDNEYNIIYDKYLKKTKIDNQINRVLKYINKGNIYESIGKAVKYNLIKSYEPIQLINYLMRIKLNKYALKVAKYYKITFTDKHRSTNNILYPYQLRLT
jgi:hypothetical protein